MEQITEPVEAEGVDESSLRGSFVDLFSDYYSLICVAAFNRLGDRDAAEDAAEEVFTIAWRRRLDQGHVFTLPWLYQTLRHVIGNEYRRRERMVRREDSVRESLLLNPIDSQNSNQDDAWLVREAVHKLAEPDRELVWMAYWEDLSQLEMAEILGCSLSAVKVRLLRARKRLKSHLPSELFVLTEQLQSLNPDIEMNAEDFNYSRTLCTGDEEVQNER